MFWSRIMSKKRDLKALLDQMTLQEKADQLLQLASVFYVKEKAEITGPINHFGLDDESMARVGTMLGGVGAETAIRIQKKHIEEDRNHIPMVFMRDIIHGCYTIFPIPLAMGCTFDAQLMEDCSHMAALEGSVSGSHVTFTPMVDYVRDARWGRVMETCGEDAMLNGVMGAAQVRGFQGDDISAHDRLAACVKHFAAYGGADAGRDYNTVEISERTLRQFYFPAYKACIDADVKMLMPSFNSLNGIPSIANKWLMNRVLREEWGFDGLVISDYNAVGELKNHGIVDNLKDGARLAFEAGCDIDMMSPSYHKHLPELVKEGIIDEKDLDAVVLKFLEFKEELGLFDDPYHGADPEKEKEICLCHEHRALALRAAQDAAVLLKNNGILPFSKEVKKIAVIGPFADNYAIKGSWAASGKDSDCATVKMGVARLLPNAEITVATGCGMLWTDTDKSGFDEAVAAAKNADIVILCLGEPQNYSGEACSRTDLRLPGVQEDLAKAVINANANTAVLLFNGRPLVLSELDKVAPAILEMWMPGTEGGNAAADLLFGDVNPSGKLSMSFPKSVGQCPICYTYYTTGRPKSKADEVYEPFGSDYIDCGILPLYFFGQGLSYTDFVYESMILDKNEIDENGEITVSVTVRNTGDREGREVVQLYLRDPVSETVRPTQELIAFEKITLAAGESKTVEFKVTEPMLRYYNFDCEFVSEKGDFELMVGYANHFALKERFKLI